jgi:hypothetical protein
MAAMASGLPVVGVDAGALAELVHAGENGFLARPGDARDVAGGLDLLCRDADLRARMSKASSRIIAHHDRHRLLARWEFIYRAVISRGETVPPGDTPASDGSYPRGRARWKGDFIGHALACRRVTCGTVEEKNRRR